MADWEKPGRDDVTCERHNWVGCITTPNGGKYWVCLNCCAMYLLTEEAAYWHASTGTPLPESNPNAFNDPRSLVVGWRPPPRSAVPEDKNP